MSVVRILPLLALLLFASCHFAPTSVRIDTDPPGADVECASLGYLGATPLQKQFSADDARKLGGHIGWIGGTGFNATLTISKRGYLPITRTVPISIAEHMPLKLELQPLLEEIQITSEPDGVGVFVVTLDAAAPGSAQSLFTADPAKAAANPAVQPFVLRRYLGQTPHVFQPDPANPIAPRTPLLFQKAGYNDAVLFFQPLQARQHVVMVPTIVQAR